VGTGCEITLVCKEIEPLAAMNVQPSKHEEITAITIVITIDSPKPTAVERLPVLILTDLMSLKIEASIALSMCAWVVNSPE